tara:strand:- start:19884 stop:20789 length:906 start_codon:yes stop_codon:yes gene_type:complete
MNKRDFLKSFEDKGIIDFGQILSSQKCLETLNIIRESRSWSDQLFRSYEDVRDNPQFKKVNPGRGVSNFAEKLDLSFIEKDSLVKETLDEILGKDYEIILKKFVVGVPDSWLPDWLKPIISKNLTANLGEYIKTEFRDVTYFRGIDFHMDLIDHPGKAGDYVTLYVYLDNVSERMSPLHVVEKSHIFGATKFPHNIKIESKDEIKYGLNSENLKSFKKKILTGKAGSLYIWSSMTLHGTIPVSGDLPRFSLRYTIKKNDKNKKKFLIDKLLNSVDGLTKLNTMRDDLDKSFKQVKFKKVLK